MSDKILFVDDEVQILNSMKRQLRKRFQVVTAESGQEALEIMKTAGPFSVIVSDMRMPVMDGVQLLTTIKDMYPDTVRLMLTGNADQETAIEAVNKGQIFRFLNKPCPTSMLVTSLALAQRQYRLITAERELLDKTLKGSVKVLSELLSFTSPAAFSSGLRIRSMAVQIGEELAIDQIWRLEVAALMSQIGCVTLPEEIINKVYADLELDEEEKEMYGNHPQAGARLFENIPRMEGVTAIIRNQLKDYSEYDQEDQEEEEIILGAQILRVIFEYDRLLFQGKNHGEAVHHLQERKNVYNPIIVKRLGKIKKTGEAARVVSLMIKDLAIGMVAEDDIYAQNETLLAPKGQELTWPVIQGLQNFAKKVGVKEPVRVWVNKK
ncbi:MAG: response regulator [Desulfocapsaceae bacterium]|nr:response regulator [Desulfocapsaceae bacterium]